MAYDRQAFGRYIRSKRKDLGIPQRQVAKALQISVPYFCEIERGSRPPLNVRHWKKLMKELPNLELDELDFHASMTRPVELDLTALKPLCQRVTRALLRRLKAKSLTDTECSWLIDILESR